MSLGRHWIEAVSEEESEEEGKKEGAGCSEEGNEQEGAGCGEEKANLRHLLENLMRNVWRPE